MTRKILLQKLFRDSQQFFSSFSPAGSGRKKVKRLKEQKGVFFVFSLLLLGSKYQDFWRRGSKRKKCLESHLETNTRKI